MSVFIIYYIRQCLTHTNLLWLTESESKLKSTHLTDCVIVVGAKHYYLLFSTFGKGFPSILQWNVTPIPSMIL